MNMNQNQNHNPAATTKSSKSFTVLEKQRAVEKYSELITYSARYSGKLGALMHNDQ
jgi:hypothetical protein